MNNLSDKEKTLLDEISDETLSDLSKRVVFEYYENYLEEQKELYFEGLDRKHFEKEEQEMEEDYRFFFENDYPEEELIEEVPVCLNTGHFTNPQDQKHCAVCGDKIRNTKR